MFPVLTLIPTYRHNGVNNLPEIAEKQCPSVSRTRNFPTISPTPTHNATASSSSLTYLIPNKMTNVFTNQTSPEMSRLTPCPVQSGVQCLSACTLQTWPPRHAGACTSLSHHTTAWWWQGTAWTCSPWITICEHVVSSCHCTITPQLVQQSSHFIPHSAIAQKSRTFHNAKLFL